MSATHPTTPPAPPAGGGARANAPRRWMHLPRSRARRLLFLSFYLGFCWGFAWLGIKFFWLWHGGVPLDETPINWDFFYVKIRQSKVQETHPRHADDHFDVLLLGGSVLDPEWGDLERRLTERLQEESAGRCRVVNLAMPGHTSRDSLIKYTLLAAEEFDLVVIYDGINDVRMNCCPPELFRDDYTHCLWYRWIQDEIDAGTLAVPVRLTREAGLVRICLELNRIDPAMVEFGREIKTAGPLRRNLEQIVTTADARGDGVLLMTFAYDIPGDYSDEGFTNRDLDYSYREDGKSRGVALWGRAPHVAAALDAHNAAIRALAGEHPAALFVDQRALLPEEKRYFTDPCHLTEEGSRKFVDNLWPAVEHRLRDWQATRGSAKVAGTLRVPSAASSAKQSKRSNLEKNAADHADTRG